MRWADIPTDPSVRTLRQFAALLAVAGAAFAAWQWWRHEKSEDRYNYLYSSGELKEFTETAEAAQALVKKLYLYTNNHFSAKSVANAVMIKQQLGQPLEGEYPPEFLERYPELAGAVKTSAPSLLHGHLHD